MGLIILASGSPRRKELLEQIRLPFEIRVSTCEEQIRETLPEKIVEELSALKASDIALSLSKEEKRQCLIIGADTVVSFDGHILGKPSDEKEAFSMLSSLSGTVHQVYTGVTLIYYQDGIRTQRSFYECSDVFFYPLSADEIHAYIATGEPMDKAGAYGIQGLAAAFVKCIKGDYYNIVGLPVARLRQEIKDLVPTFLNF